MRFKKDEIILLLGAGCSAEAGIPTSAKMIGEIEEFITGIQKDERVKWTEYKELYDFVKSSILFGSGIKGKFGPDENYNIEKLVNTLAELEKREDHILYPFIGSWNNRLSEVAGAKFNLIKELRKSIVNRLREWVTIKNYQDAVYYSYFTKFRDEYTFPLRVFSLNYDLCLEHHIGASSIETGFDNNNARIWTSRKFEEVENIPSADIYLYKLHGSINWERDKEGNLVYSDEIAKISKPELIFGTNYKLQYTDPYLFFVSELRKFTLETQLIVTVGYGFGDEHINKILEQSIRSDAQRKIICNCLDGNRRRAVIEKELNPLNAEQIVIRDITAKSFLIDELTIANLEQYLPPEDKIVEFAG